MQNQQRKSTPKRRKRDNRGVRRRPQRSAVPFQQKERSFAEWSYDHRAGILVTLIAYLIFGILFVGAKIKVNSEIMDSSILVEFPDEREVEFTPEQIRMLEMMEQLSYDDFSDVSNIASNEGVDFGELQRSLNARLSDDRGTEAEEIYGSAGELDAQMEANRRAYQEGLARQQAMIDAHNQRNSAENSEGDGNQDRQDVRVKGRVTVSFSFLNPVRTSQKLVVPAYRCEGGGEVTIIASLDHNGYVISAEVDRGSSSGDGCMQRTAMDAARSSRFNLDTSAPSPQRGTITYMFIPQ